MFKGLRLEMVQFHLFMSDHDKIRNLRSPIPELSNDISYVCLLQTLIISTCLGFEV